MSPRGTEFLLAASPTSLCATSSTASPHTFVMSAIPIPACTALAAAMQTKGMSYKDIAIKMGKPEPFVLAVCTGAVRCSAADFNALAEALEIKDTPPHDEIHETA